MTWDFSPTASVRTENVLRGQVSIAQQRCPEMHKTAILSRHYFKGEGEEGRKMFRAHSYIHSLSLHPFMSI